jgi:hypothetical protein
MDDGMDDGMDVDYDPSDDEMESSADESLTDTDTETLTDTDTETPMCTVALSNSYGGVLHAFLFEGEVSDATVLGNNLRVRDEVLATQAMTLMLFAGLERNIGTHAHEFIRDPMFDPQLLRLMKTFLR